MEERQFYVYFMTNYSCRVLYVGVTNNLERRVWEHRNGFGSEFAKKYRVNRLVYIETFPTALEAIAREKQVKGWKRVRKNALVVGANPRWEDLMPYEGRESMTT